MVKPANKYSFVESGNKEYIKQYITYDGSNRAIYIYEAMANSEHGDLCLRTEYAYDGTSSRVAKMKETESTWDSSYDI